MVLNYYRVVEGAYNGGRSSLEIKYEVRFGFIGIGGTNGRTTECDIDGDVQVLTQLFKVY